MSKSKYRKPLVAFLIALIAFLTFVGATRYYISQHVNTVSVLATSTEIMPLTKITPEMLTEKQVPQGHVPEGAAPVSAGNMFAETSHFTGEVGLHSNEVITQDKIFTESELPHADMAAMEENKTILGVSTDLVRSAGAFVFPGTHVRAIGYMELEGEHPKAEVIYDNLRVVDSLDSSGVPIDSGEGRNAVPSVLRLAVTPEQERVLIEYQEQADVWFTVLPEGYEPQEQFDTPEPVLADESEDEPEKTEEDADTIDEEPDETEDGAPPEGIIRDLD